MEIFLNVYLDKLFTTNSTLVGFLSSMHSKHVQKLIIKKPFQYPVRIVNIVDKAKL